MVAAALGASLVVMALRVTASRHGHDPAVLPAIDEGRDLIARLSAHADEDVAVFDRYMDAVRLPKATAEEVAARRAALQAAAAEATRVPLAAAGTAAEALALAARAASLASIGIASDVGAGAATLLGAVRAVLLAVDVNLRSIEDAATRAGFIAARDAILAEANRLGEATISAVQARLA